jgi:hypothetical protein
VLAAMSFRRSINVVSGRAPNALSNSNIYTTSEVVSLLGSISTRSHFETDSLGDLAAPRNASVFATKSRLCSINGNTAQCWRDRVTFRLEPLVSKKAISTELHPATYLCGVLPEKESGGAREPREGPQQGDQSKGIVDFHVRMVSGCYFMGKV